MKKLKMILTLILCLTLVGEALAIEGKVGVKSGDWAKYDLSSTSVSGSTEGMTINGTMKMTIQSATNTYITGTVEFEFAGFGSNVTIFSIDVSTWSGSGAGFVMPAGFSLNGTLPGNLEFHIGVWNGRKALTATALTPYKGFTGTIYWDQETGILLEGKITTSLVRETLKLTETNLWANFKLLGLDWWLWIVIACAMAIAITFAVALVRRGRKKPFKPVIEPAVLSPQTTTQHARLDKKYGCLDPLHHFLDLISKCQYCFGEDIVWMILDEHS